MSCPGSTGALSMGIVLGLLIGASQPAAGKSAPLGHPDFYPSRERPFGWRGDGSGLFPGASPPLTWNLETRENVLWTADLPGHAHASVVLAGDKIITLCEPTWILCHDKMTGEELWRRSASYDALGEEFAGRDLPLSRFVKEEYGFTCPTPVTDGQYVWCNFGHGALVCYDLQGCLVWAASFPTETKMRSGISQSPCLAGNVIVMGAASEYGVAGFDCMTGHRLWKVPRGGGQRGKGNFQTVRIDGKPYALASDGIIFEPRTGRVMQDRMLHPEGGRNYGPTPVVDAELGLAFLHNLTGKDFCATPIRLDGGAQSRKWVVEYPRMEKSPLCYDGLVYLVASGKLTVLDALTGDELYAQDGLTGGYPSPALGGKHIYLLPSGKPEDVVVFEPGRQYKEAARFKVHFPGKRGGNGQLGASPVFDGPRVYHRDGTKLYCFAPTRGAAPPQRQRSRRSVPSAPQETQTPAELGQAGTDPEKLVPLLKHRLLSVRLEARRRLADRVLPKGPDGGAEVRNCTFRGAAAPLDDAVSTEGLPIVPFTDDEVPAQWLVCGPFPGFVPRKDCMVSIGGSAVALPREGQPLTFRGRTCTFRKVQADSFWKDERFTGKWTAIDITHCLQRQFFSTATFLCVIRNDRPRFVTFDMVTRRVGRQPPHDNLDSKAWLGGVPIDGDAAVSLEAGLYPLVVQLAIGWTPEWGRIWALPRLVEVPEKRLLTAPRKQERLEQLEKVAPHLRSALADPHGYCRYHAMWILSRLGWEVEYFRDDVERALSDEVNDVAMLACEAAAVIDRPASSTVKRLVRLLENTFCAGPAGRALRSLFREPREGLDEAAAPIREALLETEGRLQSQLAGFAVSAGIDVPFEQCVAEYREDTDGKWFFITQMIEYGDYSAVEAVPFVVAELKSGAESHTDRHLRQLCRALVRYGADAAPAATAAVPLLQRSDNGLREAAATLLGAIGPKAKDALADLDRLAESDPDKGVKASAAEAARRIRGGRDPKH